MSIDRHAGVFSQARVTGPDAMVETVLELGIVPFFENPIPGFSIEEMTPPEFWFEGDELGPWDWKIACVQSGEIAYGKFLWGGKAAFATVECYRELMNYRRSLPKYQPEGVLSRIMDYVDENSSITIKEVRALLGVKKSAADAAIARLENQTRLVIGDFQRVYRGPDLHYSGWQTASFCKPEDLFETKAPAGAFPPGFPFAPSALTEISRTPGESLGWLRERVISIAPHASSKDLDKLLG